MPRNNENDVTFTLFLFQLHLPCEGAANKRSVQSLDQAQLAMNGDNSVSSEMLSMTQRRAFHLRRYLPGPLKGVTGEPNVEVRPARRE